MRRMGNVLGAGPLNAPALQLDTGVAPYAEIAIVAAGDFDIQPPKRWFIVECGNPFFFEGRGFSLDVIGGFQSFNHFAFDIQSCANEVPPAAAQIEIRTVAGERAIFLPLFQLLRRYLGKVRNYQLATNFNGRSVAPMHLPIPRIIVARENVARRSLYAVETSGADADLCGGRQERT